MSPLRKDETSRGYMSFHDTHPQRRKVNLSPYDDSKQFFTPIEMAD